MKTVKVNGKEVQIKDWNQFWHELEVNRDNRIELTTVEEDPEVYIYSDGRRFDFYAKSNWYDIVIHANANLIDGTILSLIGNAVYEWEHVDIRKNGNIYHVKLTYQSDYIGEPVAEVNFFTAIWKAYFEEFIKPVHKIQRELRKFFKTW